MNIQPRYDISPTTMPLVVKLSNPTTAGDNRRGGEHVPSEVGPGHRSGVGGENCGPRRRLCGIHDERPHMGRRSSVLSPFNVRVPPPAVTLCHAPLVPHKYLV